LNVSKMLAYLFKIRVEMVEIRLFIKLEMPLVRKLIRTQIKHTRPLNGRLGVTL
jgi:hypothetical protein